MENTEEKDIVRKCSNCGRILPPGYEWKTCEKCRQKWREKDARKKERLIKRRELLKSSPDLFDFSKFEEEEQKFLERRLEKYLESEEYDLEDPVVEYQLYSILIEELEIRKLRLKILVEEAKPKNRTIREKQIASANT